MDEGKRGWNLPLQVAMSATTDDLDEHHDHHFAELVDDLNDRPRHDHADDNSSDNVAGSNNDDGIAAALDHRPAEHRSWRDDNGLCGRLNFDDSSGRGING